MINPGPGWHRFDSDEEKLEYLRANKLIPKTKGLRQFIYSGGESSRPTVCDVVGFDDKSFAVISINGELHTIHKDLLLEMQTQTTSSEYKVNYIRKPNKSPASFVVFDFETTDRNHKLAEVVEIGAVKYENYKQTETFHSLVSYSGQMSMFALSVHGITSEELENKPTPEEVFPKFLNFIGDLPVVAFNGATFDFLILARICSALKIPCQLDGYDAMQVAKAKLKGPDRYTLESLRDYYELGDIGHRGLEDAMVAAEIWKMCFPEVFPDMNKTETPTTAIWQETNSLTAAFSAAIKNANQNYDLNAITTEHRAQKSAETEALLVLGCTVFVIRGARTRYAYFSKQYTRQLEKCAVPVINMSDSSKKISVQDLIAALSNTNLAQELYEACLATSDPFGCCASYVECSDAGKCVKTDAMVFGRCQYRKNLMEGRIFYGKNANLHTDKQKEGT